MLVISCFLTYGAVSEVRQTADEQSLGIPRILLLGVVWTMTLSLLASCLHARLGRIISSFGWGIAGAGLIALLLSVGLAGIVDQAEGEARTVRGNETFFVLLVSYCLVGVTLSLSGRRSLRSDEGLSRAGLILIWPLLVLGRTPLLGTFVILGASGLTYVGEHVGARCGHALIGAVCGVIVVPLTLGVLALVVQRFSARSK
jgi:hypothetical protein